jgi:uncharacterized protein YbcI
LPGNAVEKTRGQIEAEITEAVIRFEKEYMGRGPEEARTYIIDDMVLVRLKGVLSRAEQQLAITGDSPRGRELIKQVRCESLERGRPFLEAVVRDAVRQNVVSLHTDISTITGERVIVFTLEGPPHFSSQT